MYFVTLENIRLCVQKERYCAHGHFIYTLIAKKYMSHFQGNALKLMPWNLEPFLAYNLMMSQILHHLSIERNPFKTGQRR